MTLLEEYEQAWYQLDPCDPRYDDKGCKVCPNNERFMNRFKPVSELDQELQFDSD